MSLSVSKTRLSAITRDFFNHWEQTKDYWHDAKSQEFELHYMELLRTSVDKAATVIDELDRLLARIRSDCE